MTIEIELGNSARVKVTFKDTEGNPQDVSNASLRVYTTVNGMEQLLRSYDLERVSTGVYKVDIPFTTLEGYTTRNYVLEAHGLVGTLPILSRNILVVKKTRA